MFAFWDHPPWIALFPPKNAFGILPVIHRRVRMFFEETWLKRNPLLRLPLFERGSHFRCLSSRPPRLPAHRQFPYSSQLFHSSQIPLLQWHISIFFFFLLTLFLSSLLPLFLSGFPPSTSFLPGSVPCLSAWLLPVLQATCLLQVLLPGFLNDQPQELSHREQATHGLAGRLMQFLPKRGSPPLLPNHKTGS